MQGRQEGGGGGSLWEGVSAAAPRGWPRSLHKYRVPKSRTFPLAVQSVGQDCHLGDLGSFPRSDCNRNVHVLPFLHLLLEVFKILNVKFKGFSEWFYDVNFCCPFAV